MDNVKKARWEVELEIMRVIRESGDSVIMEEKR